MTRTQIEDFIISHHMLDDADTVMLLDGFDDAFIGLDTSTPPRAVYSSNAILALLMKDMSAEDAREYFEFNIECGYYGEQTPIYITTP